MREWLAAVVLAFLALMGWWWYAFRNHDALDGLDRAEGFAVRLAVAFLAALFTLVTATLAAGVLYLFIV